MPETKLDYEQSINRVIDYVDKNYSEPINLEQLSGVSHFSPFHFHRLFTSLVGETPNEYVRRIRLQKALRRIETESTTPLVQIAIESGFGTQASFNKAFKAAYDLKPSESSREAFLKDSKIRQDLMANTFIDTRKKLQDGNTDRFEVTLKQFEEREVAVVRVIGGFGPKIVEGLQRMLAWGEERGLMPGATLIGMSKDDPDFTPMDKYRFDWCLELPDGFERDRNVSYGVIAGGQYAVLNFVGDLEKLHRAWGYLYGVWLPSSGCVPRDEPSLEVFMGSISLTSETFEIQCRLPIRS